MGWEHVHGPARAVMYELLSSQDAAMAKSLHDEGWRGQPLKPLGLTAPQFKGAPKKRGVYTTSRDGSVWLGSPVPEIAAVLVSALASRTEIVWGPARLKVRGFTVDVGASAPDGPVEMETATPVVVLPAPSGLRVLEAGPRRRFTVRGAPRIGAQVRVAMEADPRFVEALRSWGLGLDTLQGFGWIR
ncbi:MULTISPECIES: CRISPR-associated endoribonuclease Cas6 [unclassified Streptomyces]|uniref:CRISPR-associated endoribonuclease Cas6 n=1 Tax=unclassified Streptomyces TaxID=2593676 RepID=UPI003450265C